MITHHIIFVSSNHGEFEIDEPIGFDGADFTIEQENGRLGRDVSFAGGSGKLRLMKLPDHVLNIILYNREIFGFEAIIKYQVRFDNITARTYELNMESSTTDEDNYFEFVLVEENERALLKANADIKNNLFSYTDLFGDGIVPVNTEKVLLKAKPIIQYSEWINPTIGNVIEHGSIPGVFFLNVVRQQVKYGINDSLTWLMPSDPSTSDVFKHIRAKENLSNIHITLDHNVLWEYIPFGGSSDKRGSLRIRIAWGPNNVNEAIDLGQSIDIYSKIFEGNDYQSTTLPLNLTATIPFVNATDFIWISYTIFASGAVQRFTFNECKTAISATSTATSTVVPMVRLFDAEKYIVKSSSKLNIFAPRWDANGEFFNQYITSTPLLRNLTDRAFNISFKDLNDEYFPECQGDYQIQPNGTVFLGRGEPDFYRNSEIANFEQEALEGFELSFNPKFVINQFKYKYDTYQSQKEIEVANTYDVVNGESEFKLPNLKAKNTKEVSIGWIRDPFIIEEARIKANDLTQTAATQDDDKVYLLDIVQLADEDRTFISTKFLQHTFFDDIFYLKNDKSFSWITLGLGFGDVFTIMSGENSGNYIITEITDLQITLLFLEGVPVNIVGENTTFKYIINSSVKLTNRTNEGFSNIENISDGNNFANLRFTNKRNTLNYYQSYLATACLYKQNEPIRNTLYKNNPLATTQLVGTSELPVIEGGEFIPKNPVLTPNILKTNIIMSLQDFFDLENKIRTLNGFVRIIDSTGLPTKGYIQKAVWKFLSKGAGTTEDFLGSCEMTLEERYQPAILSIFDQGNGSAIINNEIYPNAMSFQFDEFEKLLIFDEVGKLLFPPVHFSKVIVNDTLVPNNAFELMNWLTIIINKG